MRTVHVSEYPAIQHIHPDNEVVTVRLKRVPWDQVACTVAAVHKLVLITDHNVLLVQRRTR